MCVVPLPWYNRTENTTQWGVACNGCKLPQAPSTRCLGRSIWPTSRNDKSSTPMNTTCTILGFVKEYRVSSKLKLIMKSLVRRSSSSLAPNVSSCERLFAKRATPDIVSGPGSPVSSSRTSRGSRNGTRGAEEASSGTASLAGCRVNCPWLLNSNCSPHQTYPLRCHQDCISVIKYTAKI
jgi:hypothetical protein